MKLSFRQLHAFVTIARLGSFTRAAEDIHITQAGLSLMVKEMEDQLGYRLFDRTTRAVWLTRAGERFLPVVTRALQEIDEVAGHLARDREQAQRVLTVAATPLVCGTILPAVIADIHRRHADIRVAVRDVERPALQSMVEAGEVDIGVSILLKAGSGIHRQSIHQLTLQCVSPVDVPGYAAKAQPRGMAWSALKDVPLIGLPSDNVVQQQVDRQLRQIGRAGDARLAFHNMLTVIGMVEAGLGHAVLPSIAQAACRRYQVRVVDLVKPRVPLDLYAITRRGVATPPAVPVFVQALEQHLASARAA